MTYLENLLDTAFEGGKNLPDLSDQILKDIGLFDIPLTSKLQASLEMEAPDQSYTYKCSLRSDGLTSFQIWEGVLTVQY